MNDGGAKSETLLRVTEIEGRGRSLVAAQPLRAGQVILRESPLLLYSAFPFLSSPPSPYCDHCFRLLSQSSQRCRSCSLVSFCSPNCLSSHTPWLCESLRRLHQSSSAFADQSPERQVQARFLLSAYNLAAASPSDFQILLSLQGGGGEENGDRSASEFLHSLLSAVCPPLPVPISPELTAALLEKDKVNGFGLMEPFSVSNEKRSVRGYGIYPKTSFLNHDCLPNACRFDYVDSGGGGSDGNTDIIIRMIHDVPQGREVCLSYFPVNMNYSGRQKRLLEDYGFRCECDRCKVEASWSEDENEDMEEMDGGEDDQEEEEEEMEEDEGEGCGDGVDGDESSFPHAYFFARYMCEKENCFGTLAPLPPKGHDVSRFLECNVCGSVKEDEVGGNP